MTFNNIGCIMKRPHFPSLLLLLILAVTTTRTSADRVLAPRPSLLTTPATKNFVPTKLAWQTIPRGGSGDAPVAPSPTATASTTLSAGSIVTDAVSNLAKSLKGGKSDSLLLLLVTAWVPTICNSIAMSPILGFLASGVALGPQGLNAIQDIHTTELLADLGVVLFLFEMGVHLSLKTLWDMRAIVFGLGGCQMLVTAALVMLVARLCGLSLAAQVVLGGGLALSSSAFVLQLLKDKKELDTVKGKHSFGVLLLQDLAVVPLLVVTPLLAGGDGDVTTAVIKAVVQAFMAITMIALFGKFAMSPFFETVLNKSKSQEASIAVSLATILGMSFLTEGLGLSNTLGAFLAGVLLSETSFRHVVETEVSPIRGILVGLFFFSVGFEIDLPLLFSAKAKIVAAIVVGLMASKTAIITVLCSIFGLDLATSQEIGSLLSQGGEFAFVAFRLARSLKIFDEDLTKLLLTSVSVTMALTPLVEGIGSSVAGKMRAGKVVDKKKKKN